MLPVRLLRAGLLIGLLLAAAVAGAADWAHWRGPQRNDRVSEDSGWAAGAWPPKDPLWTGSFGLGSSAPLVVGGRLYALGWQKDREVVSCVEAATGKALWQTDYPAPRYGRFAIGDQGFYTGSSATPEYDAATRYLFTLGIDGDLNCWDTRAKGRRV